MFTEYQEIGGGRSRAQSLATQFLRFAFEKKSSARGQGMEERLRRDGFPCAICRSIGAPGP